MKNWCKIIEGRYHDILLTKETSDEDETPQIKVAKKYDGFEASIGLGFTSEDGLEKRDKGFDNLSRKTFEELDEIYFSKIDGMMADE